LATQLAILTLMGLDIASQALRWHPTLPASALAPDLWQQHSAARAPQPGESRVMISPQAEKHLLRSTVKDLTQDLVGKRLALWSNLNLLDGIPKVNGSSTLQVREQSQVQNALYNVTNMSCAGLIDFLAVSQITASNSVVEWAIRTNPCPMVTCGQRPVFDTPTNILKALVDPQFNPREVVYLTAEARPFISVHERTSARVLAQEFSGHRLKLVIEAEKPSLVVIAQTYFHPWRAFVDGRPTDLWRANGAFQGLEVPAGRHDVLLKYQDPAFRCGALISGLAWLATGWWWWRLRSPQTGTTPANAETEGVVLEPAELTRLTGA
jgi:hypothetical protein